MINGAIKASADFERVRALPRRTPEIDDALVGALSDLLRTPAGTMRLRPLQALALHDIGTIGGAFLPLDVGEGKTLISLLAPYVLGAERPLLILPANLIQKTDRERAELARHWRIPTSLALLSYQMLGVVDHAADLEVLRPDLIIADESQKLKNRDAAVTRRVERYMDRYPETRFVAMTGTIMRKSLHDFAHVLRWCLKDRAPVPLEDGTLDDWALALDENLADEFARKAPGVLLRLVDDADHAHLDETIAARHAFRRRLRETPGVVASAPSGTQVDVGLSIRALRYDLSDTTAAHFQRLRDEMMTPDEWPLWSAAQVWQHAKELALGFHQIWDPRPPQEWRDARRDWFSYVRDVLARSRTYDSPEHVARGCDAGHLTGQDVLARWRSIKDTFTPNPVPVWHDDSAIRVAASWMRQGAGIVWTEHTAFARRLSEITGAPYYGAKGLTDDGAFIDDGDAGACVIVSVDANREGRNLQRKWHRNLITSPAEGADLWQQLLGRTHRPGQTHDVEVDVLLGCLEHARAWAKASAAALSIRDTVGSESKLLLADVDWPDEDEIASWSGPRWGR